MANFIFTPIYCHFVCVDDHFGGYSFFSKITCCGLNFVLSPKYSSPNPWTCDCNSFGNRISADVFKLKWGHTGQGWTLIQWLVSLEEGHLDTNTQEEWHKVTKAEFGVTYLQAKEYQALLATVRNKEMARKIPLRALEESLTWPTP